MKKRRKTIPKVGLILLFFAGVAMALIPLQVGAEDVDKDGFLDEEEMASCIPLENACFDTDPYIADLFIMFEGQTLDGVPADPFEFIKTGYEASMRIHEIPVFGQDNYNQIITSEQNALLLIADPDPNDGDLGTSQIAFPAYQDGIEGRVFINRIYDDVYKACTLHEDWDCVAVNSAGQEVAQGISEIVDFYTKNVIAHETFHMLGRVVPADRKVDNHYAQLGYIMDHHMYYKEYKKEDKVKWFITDRWAEMDIPRFK